MCNMIPLQSIADTNLVSTNVPETDYAEWAVGTTYANGDRVISVATHSVFESTANGNLGNDPDVAANVDPSTGTWVRVGSTNRWRAFDRAIGQSVSQSGSIKYTLACTTMITAIGLKGIKASSVRLRIINPDAAEVNLLGNSESPTGLGVAGVRGTIAPAAGNGRSGLSTMSLFTEDTSAATTHYMVTSSVNLPDGTGTFSMDVKPNGRDAYTFRIQRTEDAAYEMISFIDVNALTATDGGTVRVVEDGIYRITGTIEGATPGNYRMLMFPLIGGTTVYDGDGTSGFFFGRLQIEGGTSETDYQEKAGGVVVGTELQNEIRQMVDDAGIQDWFDLVTFVPEFVPDYVFENAVGYVGYHVIVELDGAGGTTELSEMGWGRKVKIGDTLVGSAPGFRDKSTRTEDEFGNLKVVPRETYDTMLFRISRLVGTEENTRRILAQQGKGVCFYYADKDLFDRSPLVLGYRPDFDGPLAAAGRSFATLEIRGLV